MHQVRILVVFIVLLAAPRQEACAATEYVTVTKVLDNDDKGIIQRRNGEKWLIEKGTGARSFWKYDGKNVIIYSPGLFCGVGSKLILPNEDQEARIWNAEKLSDGIGVAVAIPKGIHQEPPDASKEETVKAVATALVKLKYIDLDPKNEGSQSPIQGLKRLQVEHSLPETNSIGPKTLVKLAELVLKQGEDNPEALDLAQTLIESARKLKAVSIKGKASTGTDFRKSFSPPVTETFITSVSANGAIVKLADGSVYEIAPVDQVTTMLWLPTENVLKNDDKLINLDNGESAEATLLK